MIVTGSKIRVDRRISRARAHIELRAAVCHDDLMSAQDPSTVTLALAGVFSWAVLATASIIISGLLLARRFPLTFVQEGKLIIPLWVFELKAQRDQVILGVMAFILALTCVVCLGGPSAYQFFRIQAGIDIGQWNSLCVIASSLTMICSLITFIVTPLLSGASPVITDMERASIISRIQELGNGQEH
jgi:hypothetical protein